MDAETCYRALCARDSRFDGMFFVGVDTTGVYCRPVCPARTPARARCRFFARAAEAEKAGFRACFRCRPEVAPGGAPADSVSNLGRQAVKLIEAGFLNAHSTGDLARLLGITPRHLRRIVESEAGVSPIELALSRRLAMAKQLLHDSQLPLSEVALTSGFASVRRFNAAFSERFGRPPSLVRKEHGGFALPGEIPVRLDFRPPLNWNALLSFLRGRAIPGVEEVTQTAYSRTVRTGPLTGWLSVRLAPARASLLASVSISLAPVLMDVTGRLRALFDLDAHPDVISAHLGQDPLLTRLVSALPGLRIPGAFDGFELAVRVILGQQVSVAGAVTLARRLVESFGTRLDEGRWLFPDAESLARLEVSQIRQIGLPERRAATLRRLAVEVAEKRLDLSSPKDPAHALALLGALAGIGPWTASVIAMRAFRMPDAFPAGDLAVRKALGVKSERAAEERVSGWKPWRSYGALYLSTATSNEEIPRA